MREFIENHERLHRLHGAKPTSRGTGGNLPNYHPDYGVTDEVRGHVLKLAEDHGPAAAAAMTGFAVGTVYKWRKDARDG